MTLPASRPFTLIVGPCVIEDLALLREVAGEFKRQLAEPLARGEIDLYFKASFDKANRTSIDGFRGPGLTEGLRMLTQIRDEFGFKVLTDFHTPEQAELVAQSVDFLQIPAFLCRQTDLIVAGAEAALKHGRKVNVKKGQFLAPWDAGNIVDKWRAVAAKMGKTPAADQFWLTERGVSYGYNTLVVDMTSFQAMQKFGVPVVYDATHSVQSPGGGTGGKSTGGKRENIEVLARAAIAAGADALFMECHPRPAQAKSDGPNAFYLEHVGAFVRQMLELRKLIQGMPKLLPEAQG